MQPVGRTKGEQLIARDHGLDKYKLSALRLPVSLQALAVILNIIIIIPHITTVA